MVIQDLSTYSRGTNLWGLFRAPYPGLLILNEKLYLRNERSAVSAALPNPDLLAEPVGKLGNGMED